jgi:hypothetical protein
VTRESVLSCDQHISNLLRVHYVYKHNLALPPILAFQRHDDLAGRLGNVRALPALGRKQDHLGRPVHTGRACRNGSRSRIRIAASISVTRRERGPRASVIARLR